MRRLLALLAFLPLGLVAQEVEYRMEVGGALGPCFYLGDVNHTPFAHSSVMGGFLLRRNLNPRMVVKTDLAFGHLSGNSGKRFIPQDAYDKTPEGGTPTRVSFKRNVVDLGAQFEMNFWGYGTGTSFKGNSRITPYALAGAGLTMAMGGGGGTNVALNFPVGLGVKYKVKPRLNVGAEWTFRFTTTDKLDVNAASKRGQTSSLDLPSESGVGKANRGQTSLAHPFGVQSVGLKNKDCYSFLMLYVTYDISPKYRKCNND